MRAEGLCVSALCPLPLPSALFPVDRQFCIGSQRLEPLFESAELFANRAGRAPTREMNLCSPCCWRRFEADCVVVLQLRVSCRAPLNPPGLNGFERCLDGDGLFGWQDDAELVDRSAGFAQPAGQKDDADAARNRHGDSFGSDRVLRFHVELTWTRPCNRRSAKGPDSMAYAIAGVGYSFSRRQIVAGWGLTCYFYSSSVIKIT